MKRGFIIILALLLSGSVVIQLASASELDVPLVIRNNRYYDESLRLTNLARLAYMDGDYDASIQYSEEAIRYSQLSDEYVRLRLKMAETDRAISNAAGRLEYAASINAAARFPSEYSNAQAAYGEARSLRTAERWDDAIAAANRVLAFLAFTDRSPDGFDAFPAQYMVRTWENYWDCLWNIAARPWAYNDPQQWRLLYEANRWRMPESGNPDLIEPGMVLDIPSIRGETRRGVWDSSGVYQSF